MLATAIELTTRVAVCSRSGAHFRNYLFFWTWQYQNNHKYDWHDMYLSTCRIYF